MSDVDKSIHKVAFECVTKNCPHLFDDNLRYKLMQFKNTELQQWLSENCRQCHVTGYKRHCPDCDSTKRNKRQKVDWILHHVGKQPREILQEEMLHLTFEEIVSICSVNKALNHTFCQFNSDEFKDKLSKKRLFWKLYFKEQPGQFGPIVSALKKGTSIPKHFVIFCLRHENFPKRVRAELFENVVFGKHPEWLQKFLLQMSRQEFPPHGDWAKNERVARLLDERYFGKYPEWLQRHLLQVLQEGDFPPGGNWSKKERVARLLDNRYFGKYPEWLQRYLLQELQEEDFPPDGDWSKKERVARLLSKEYFQKYPEWLQRYLVQELQEEDFPPHGYWSKEMQVFNLLDFDYIRTYPEWLQRYLYQLDQKYEFGP